jgi:hypothetical protein
MTFLEQLQAHKGGLVQLKTELYWYAQGRYDGNPGRVCLILDAASDDAAQAAGAAAVGYRSAGSDGVARATIAAAFLLIDGRPQWIWIVEKDVELL